MKKSFGFGVLAIALLGAIGADCCDVQHDAYVENAKAVQLCKDRGGVSTVETIQDNGGHQFLVLKRCDFPPSPIRVEK